VTTTSSNPSLIGGLAIGVPCAAVFYATAFTLMRGTYLGDLFLDRGWVPYVLVLLMGWSLGLLGLKFRSLQRERRAMRHSVFPADSTDEISPDNAQRLLEHLRSLPAEVQESLIVARIRSCLGYFAKRRSSSEVSTFNVSQSEADGNTIHSSYSMLKVFIWAIPILGFIGTVLGISEAVSGFSLSLSGVEDIEVLNASLNSVTSGLAVAFDTTLVALVMSLIISLPASALQKAEEDVLAEVDERCAETLLPKLSDGAGIPEVARHTEAIMNALGATVAENQLTILQEIGRVQERMERLQEQHLSLVGKTAAAVDQQLERMEARAADHQRSIETSFARMASPVATAVDDLVHSVRDAGDRSAEAAVTASTTMREHLRRMEEIQIEHARVFEKNLQVMLDPVETATQRIASTEHGANSPESRAVEAARTVEASCERLTEGLRGLTTALTERESEQQQPRAKARFTLPFFGRARRGR